MAQVPADEATGEIEDYEGSSIFEPFPSPVHELADDRPEDELRLAPDSELDAEKSDRPTPTREPVEEKPASELPALAELFSKAATAKPNRRVAPQPVLLDEPFETPAAAAANALETKSKRPKKKKPIKRKNQWDSPLMLLGGGGLALLLLGGLTIVWLLNTESADEKLSRAQKALDAGSYTQAVTEYQEFLENYPRHHDRGLVRVKLAIVQLRKAAEAANYEAALDLARTELPAVEDEDKFGEVAHAELAALLPGIAAGLAKQAEAAAEPETAKKLIEQSTAALALCDNATYIPKSFRREAELDEVRETLGRIERRQQSQHDLQ
ncbi:MAG: hypothetical protein WD229_05750, partial [Pirellulales bacterium]